MDTSRWHRSREVKYRSVIRESPFYPLLDEPSVSFLVMGLNMCILLAGWLANLSIVHSFSVYDPATSKTLVRNCKAGCGDRLRMYPSSPLEDPRDLFIL